MTCTWETKQKSRGFLTLLIDLQGYPKPSAQHEETPINEIPRVPFESAESTSPDLHREFMDELRTLRGQDPNQETDSKVMSESELSWPSEEPSGSHCTWSKIVYAQDRAG